MGTVDPMNANLMLDYALGRLDGPDRDRAELEAADPGQAETLERLSRAVHALLDDGDVFDPPPGLAERTIRFVAANRDRRRSILDFVPVTVPFRWADVAVAAGIFLAGVLTLLPAVGRSRDQMTQAGCTDNLQRLGRALWLYGNSHRHFPFCSEVSPESPTGGFAAMLREEGYLPDLSLLDCPSNGTSHHPPLPKIADLTTLAKTDPQQLHKTLRWDYAYNVSYRDKSGRVEPIEAMYSPQVPLLADQPDHEGHRRILAGNSRNHGGRGQNVLYTDLHVDWHNTRRLNPRDSDMFLNDRGELGPGLHRDDAVLCPSEVPFSGLRSPR